MEARAAVVSVSLTDVLSSLAHELDPVALIERYVPKPWQEHMCNVI